MKPDFLHAIGDILRSAFGDGMHDQRSDAWRRPLPSPRSRTAGEDRRFAEELIALTALLRNFARRLAQDEAAAEDLVQETLLRAWKARERFEMGTSMRSWTFTILKRLHLSGGRRRRFVGAYDEGVERSLSVEEAQSATVILTEVQDAMARLPDGQRRALEMIGIEQLSYDEAAARVDVPIGTLKSRVARARRALIALLQDRRPETPPVPHSPPILPTRWRAAGRADRLIIG